MCPQYYLLLDVQAAQLLTSCAYSLVCLLGTLLVHCLPETNSRVLFGISNAPKSRGWRGVGGNELFYTVQFLFFMC